MKAFVRRRLYCKKASTPQRNTPRELALSSFKVTARKAKLPVLLKLLEVNLLCEKAFILPYIKQSFWRITWQRTKSS
jgi:hypothetical protein